MINVMGYWVTITAYSYLYSEGNKYSYGHAHYGGCVSLTGFSSAYFRDDEFEYCTASYGGAIYASDYEELKIQSVSFSNNFAFLGKGENVFSLGGKILDYLSNGDHQVFHNALWYEGGSNLQVTGSNNFYATDSSVASGTYPQKQYSPLMILDAERYEVDGAKFDGFESEYGGAIHIKNNMNAGTLYKDMKHSIYNVDITNCHAWYDGGGIYIDNSFETVIEDSRINYNEADEEGGGVYFYCHKSLRDICKLVIKETEIMFNSANNGGGVSQNSKLFTNESSNIENNSASTYGQNVAAFSSKLLKINETLFDEYFYNDSTALLPDEPFLTAYDYYDVQSGGDIPSAYFAVIDQYNQLVKSNQGRMLELVIQPTDYEFQTVITGITRFYSMNGLFAATGLGIISQPDSAQSFIMYTYDVIDLKMPDVAAIYDEEIGQHDEYNINIDIIMRGCIAGEELLETGACRECATGTFLLEPPEEVQPCEPCDISVQCLGGTNIGPSPGYWRKSNTSVTFIGCYLPENCLGMIEPDLVPVGECSTGYYGVLCSACMPGYTREDEYGCSKCPDNLTNGIRLTALFIGVILACVFLVTSTIKGALQGQNTQSIYIKIFFNHTQMILITSSFNLKWPQQLIQFFKQTQSLAEIPTKLLSIDCFIDNRREEDIDIYNFYADDEYRMVYKKLIMYSVLPIVLGACSFLVWYLILPKDNQKDLYNKFIATYIILLFIIHPNITQEFIDMFNCKVFDEELRLMPDLQVVCYEGKHFAYALGLALPSLFIWGLGIPAVVYFLMSAESENMQTTGVMTKFGFLYNGFKKKLWFWEIVIMYRKIFCIFIAVFLNQIGIVVQALVLLILMVVFISLNSNHRPFNSRALNDIETTSLITQVITIYCGLFFISSVDKNLPYFNDQQDYYLGENGTTLLNIIIIGSNFAFAGMWVIRFIDVMRVKIKDTYPKLYVYLYLCGNWEKLKFEDDRIKKDEKRQMVVEKVEELQFYFSNMKEMYAKEIFYEGHDRFIALVYHIESERNFIDLTEKKHNYYIQGDIARHRMFDPTRIQEIRDMKVLRIDEEFGGDLKKTERKNIIKQQKQEKEQVDDSSATFMSTIGRLRQLKLDLEEQKKQDALKKEEQNSKIMSQKSPTPLKALKDNSLASVEEKVTKTKPHDKSGMSETTVRNPASDQLSNQYVASDQMSAEDQFGSNDSSMLSDGDVKSNEKKKKRKKKANLADVNDVVFKSRNMKTKLQRHKKSRVFIKEFEDKQGGDVKELNNNAYVLDGFQMPQYDDFEEEIEKNLKLTRQLTEREKINQQKKNLQNTNLNEKKEDSSLDNDSVDKDDEQYVLKKIQHELQKVVKPKSSGQISEANMSMKSNEISPKQLQKALSDSEAQTNDLRMSKATSDKDMSKSQIPENVVQDTTQQDQEDEEEDDTHILQRDANHTRRQIIFAGNIYVKDVIKTRKSKRDKLAKIGGKIDEESKLKESIDEEQKKDEAIFKESEKDLKKQYQDDVISMNESQLKIDMKDILLESNDQMSSQFRYGSGFNTERDDKVKSLKSDDGQSSDEDSSSSSDGQSQFSRDPNAKEDATNPKELKEMVKNNFMQPENIKKAASQMKQSMASNDASKTLMMAAQKLSLQNQAKSSQEPSKTPNSDADQLSDLAVNKNILSEAQKKESTLGQVSAALSTVKKNKSSPFQKMPQPSEKKVSR